MKARFFFCVFFLMVASLGAQTPGGAASPTRSPAKPPLPTGPLLKAAGDYSQWEISFVYADDKQAAANSNQPKEPDPTRDARLRRSMTTKTGRIVHEQQSDVINRAIDFWFDGPTQYYRGEGNPTWFQLEPGSIANSGMASVYKALPPSGYRDLDWINANSYAGTIPYGQTSCLIFVPGGYEKLDLSDLQQRQRRLETADTIAYIDEAARLPIVVRAHGITRIFRFNPPPSEMQRLPDDLADQVKKGKEGRARLELPAPRPY